MLLLYIIAFLFLAYSIILLYYWYAWITVPLFKADEDTDKISFSIIIPARNEENNIGNLLQSISNQDYIPEKREVIVIDDHSTDQTANVAKQFSFVRLITSPGSKTAHKKKAVETGIHSAHHEWIVATDADCRTNPLWLQTISSFIKEKNSVFVASPVVIDHRLNVLGCFQSMDFMMLQGITGAVVHRQLMSMCNGANIAYQKKAFEEVKGFSGIDDIASGDDMLLMYKIQKLHGDRVHYLKSKNAIVSTAAAGSWKEFFNQRIRWASKARRYQDKRILPVLAIVYAFNLSFLFLALAAVWDSWLWNWLIGLIAGKTLVELPLFWSAANFFNKKSLIPIFPLFQPLHILYTVVSGAFSQFGKYTWKGRVVK